MKLIVGIYCAILDLEAMELIAANNWLGNGGVAVFALNAIKLQ